MAVHIASRPEICAQRRSCPARLSQGTLRTQRETVFLCVLCDLCGEICFVCPRLHRRYYTPQIGVACAPSEIYPHKIMAAGLMPSVAQHLGPCRFRPQNAVATASAGFHRQSGRRFGGPSTWLRAVSLSNGLELPSATSSPRSQGDELCSPERDEASRDHDYAAHVPSAHQMDAACRRAYPRAASRKLARTVMNAIQPIIPPTIPMMRASTQPAPNTSL
jgi:hypothetical protein